MRTGPKLLPETLEQHAERVRQRSGRFKAKGLDNLNNGNAHDKEEPGVFALARERRAASGFLICDPAVRLADEERRP